jgi:CRP-like cAMP-binding protein
MENLADAKRAPAPQGGSLVLVQTIAANRILAGLTPGDFAALQPELSRIELPVRRHLEMRNRPIEHVYFLESGLASMVVSAGAQHSIEVGIIGHEGMTGLPILLGTDRAAHETFVQTAGTAWRIGAEPLRAAVEKSSSLRRRLLNYAQVMMTQMAFTALANGRYKIEERLARWLLMADDRAEDSIIHLTHDFLAVMLGSRRAGVTAALNHFQKRQVLQMRRGVITITDRSALEETANGSYGGPEAEYRRLFEPGSL